MVLFCHSMYGMSPKHRFIKQALSMVISQPPPQESLVIVFHRANDALHDLDGLVCHRTATFPTGAIRIPNTNAALGTFAPFIAGFAPQSTDPDTPATLTSWRKTCRALARHEAAGHTLLFTAPSAMAAFTPHASTALPILLAQVPSGEMRLGVTMFESSTTEGDVIATLASSTLASALWGPEVSCKTVDSVGLFDAEMYMSGMHGGHGGGKTSSFKRCLFLSRIGSAAIASRLRLAISTRPSPLCYLHLLQGGGAISDVAPNATAFGCRDWDFACVITGVWPRDQDGDTEAARAAVQWVYTVARDLLMYSSGAYGADLGPDPRDAVLAARAFGPNASRLARLKRRLDPQNVLAYACPLLPQAPAAMEQKLVILVTGESGAGKDYCADVWLSAFVDQGITARVVSISDAVKREYAAATGADLGRLLENRAYKEHHRPALTAFYQEQARQRPQLPEEHFLDIVHAADDVDVLLVTGMRDEAPVAAYSHLVPDRRLLEVYVRADAQTRLARRGYSDSNNTSTPSNPPSTPTHAPTLIFANDAAGAVAATAFASHRLLPFAHADLQRLAAMVRAVPPDHLHAPGIAFRHVLGIAQQAGGLALATSLLQTHFAGAWSDVDAIVCCEAGGWVYAAALALRVDSI
ncbi:putative phosphoribosyl transferase domain protein [Diplodia seriata]|uniref:Putative phosphoribosyl transferase domain protein n=1 Tax=Diplodia seriata TaxID=420778 RepID=A0A0G2DQX2_9PEZI|nr:putative phosphoribosyl transferase domain protein [Diplodia seriata]